MSFENSVYVCKGLAYQSKGKTMADRAFLERLSRELADKGKLIEAGWTGFRLAVISPDAPAIQLDEMRKAFFAGSQHLFTSIMTIMDPGQEPTEADLERLTLINKELEEFAKNLLANHPKLKG
jgi:hypothetical protein